MLLPSTPRSVGVTATDPRPYVVQMHNEPSDERWTQLVHRLHEDADDLIAEFMRQVLTIPPYAAGVVPAARVEADAVATFDYLLRRVGGLPLPDRVRQIGPAVGRDRARRGVPLEDLLTAVRLDFRVLWAALRARAGADDVPVIVSRVEEMWMVVEEFITTIQVSYLEESALMARERRRERSALVAKLLGSTDPDPADVHRVALALDVDAATPVLVAATPAAADGDLRRLADRLSAAGRHVHVQEEARHTLLLTPWLGDVAAPCASVLEGVTCGVGPLASGLAQVPRSARVAAEIADALPAGRTGPHELGEAWLWLVGSRLGELADELSRPLRRGMADARAGEWDRLCETVTAYTATGSVQQVAEQMYCHRNTVVNRLRRFADLTGWDVTVPTEAVLAVAVLSWAEAGALDRRAAADVAGPRG